MSLNILWTDDERLAGADVTRALASALSSCVGATLFVPSFAQQQLAARQVARHPDLSLGVTVTTPLAWAEERWGIWGDGRGLVDEAARCLLTREVLSSAPDELRGGLGTNPGTRRLVGELASRALPWMPPAKDGKLDDARVCGLGLTGGEKAALGLVGRYAQRLHDHGLIERSELLCGVADALREAGVVVAPVVVSGFTSMDRAERELLAGLAGLCEVMVAFGRKNAELLAGCEELAESLRALADRGARREGPGTRHDGSQGAVSSATVGVRQGGEMGLVPSVPADTTPADAAPSLVRDPELEELLGRVQQSFCDTFINQHGYLFDYVNPHSTRRDWSVRPNMIFATSLPYSPLPKSTRRSVIEIITRELRTPKGLRSLSPKSDGYQPQCHGTQLQREQAYYNGSVWPWLLGPYFEACLKLYGRSAISFIERTLIGMEEELQQHGVNIDYVDLVWIVLGHM